MKCPSPIRTCWHVPAFGRFVLTSIAYGSTIIQSFCRWASLRTFLSVVAATPGSFLLLRASSELPLIPRDRKPELVTCLTAHAVASVLPHLPGIAQTRKLSKFVHCTLIKLILAPRHEIHLLESCNERAPLLRIRRVAFVRQITPDFPYTVLRAGSHS